VLIARGRNNNDMEYNHTQVGKLISQITVIVSIIFVITLILDDSALIIIPFVLFVFIPMSSFFSLNVRVDDKQIRIKFGYGIFSKSFNLNEIEYSKTVRNKWYYGYGIKFWFFPRMIIFNVSGLDAVEIRMRNGKIFRIGTDDPITLDYVIKSSIKPTA